MVLQFLAVVAVALLAIIAGFLIALVVLLARLLHERELLARGEPLVVTSDSRLRP